MGKEEQMGTKEQEEQEDDIYIPKQLTEEGKTWLLLEKKMVYQVF